MGKGKHYPHLPIFFWNSRDSFWNSKNKISFHWTNHAHLSSYSHFASLKPPFFKKVSPKQADIGKINMNEWNQNLLPKNL